MTARRRRRLRLLPLSTFDRFIIGQVVSPTFLGFLTFTFLMLMRPIFTLMEQVFVRGVEPRDALTLLWITTPHVIVFTIPMSYLFGVLIAVGRMNSDNEVTAMQAGGISLGRVLRPIAGLGLVMAMLNGYLMLMVMPEASVTMRKLRVRMFTSAKALGRVDPRVFHEGFPNYLLYVKEVDETTGVWRDVLLFDRTNPGEERLTLARRGRMVTGTVDGDATHDDGTARPSTAEPWLILEDVVTHQFSPSKPATYRVNTSQLQTHKLTNKTQGRTSYTLGLDERSSAELLAMVRDRWGDATGNEPDGSVPAEDRRLAALELNRRVAFPLACVVFSLLALPLGIGSRSGGRGRGFLLSLGVILVYYILFNNGHLMAREGRVPVWLGAWFPNIALSFVALLMMRRMGRWLGERRRGESMVAAWLQSIGQAWRDRRIDRRRNGELATGSIPVSLQRRRYASTFPTALDRYVTRRLLGPLLFVLLSTAVLYVVVDFTDHLDEISSNKVASTVVLAYYWNRLPQVALDVTPFAVLIGILLLLTMMERNLELTSFKAAGISLYRLVVPVLLVAAVAAAGLWFLGESVVPGANREAKWLLDIINGRSTARSYQATDRQWLMSRDDSTLYNFLQYDSRTRTMIRFTMFQFDEDMQLRFQLFAPEVRYENGAWVVTSGWFRQVYADGTDEFRNIKKKMELGIPEGPDYFGQEYRAPSEMTHRDLRNYIDQLQASGYRPVKLLVQWHQKFTYPLSAFIMAFLALPFGLNRGGRRTTTMQGIGLALGLGIAYFLLVAVFGEMGEASLLPAAVGAWSPVILAALFSLNRLTTLRT
jgi:LPS export ABC transporter permease LptG/LPS export ABC transporter permease LptF